MPNLREEIRAILREEIASLRAEAAHLAMPVHEPVRIASSAELNRFAQDIARRAADPEFRTALARGDMLFELTGGPSQAHAPASAPVATGPARTAPDTLTKPLVTERDIAALDRATRALRLGPSTRLTPLARDEARRLGIRIERIET